MKKKSIYGLVVCFLSIILIILAWNYRQKNKPIVLEFGMFAESNWDVKNANAYVIIDDAIKKFEKEHPGVKVHYETGIRKEDYSEWLDRKILEGETPDVFMVLSDDFYKYVSLNVISDLDNQIANDRNFKKEYFFDTVLDIGKYHESQYALPYEVVPTLMFVNKTLLEQEGIEVPNENWTWSTMEQIVDQITKDKNGDGVIDQFGTYNYTWKEAVYSNGAELFDKDGKKAFFSGTKVNEAVKFVKKLNEMNGGREVTQNDFDSGNVAFMPLAFSEYRTYKTYPYKIKKYTSFQWDCTSMPAGPGGHNTSEVDALLMTIGNKSKHKELAWEFLKMLTSDSSIQREIFEYSQGASVLKYVTGSRYAESMIRKDMDVDERVIDNRLLIDAIENGRINPKFSKYPEAMALAENEIDDIYKNEKNIDISLKVFQRSITKFLNQ